MSKGRFAPITPEMLEAQYQAKQAQQVQKPVGSSLVESNVRNISKGYSNAQKDAYYKDNANPNFVGGGAPSDILLEQEVAAQKAAQTKVSQDALAEVDKKNRLEPKNPLERRSQEIYKDTDNYEKLKDLQQKKGELKGKKLSWGEKLQLMAIGNSASPASLVLDVVGKAIPDTWGRDENVVKEVEKLDRKIHSLQTPAVQQIKSERQALLAEQQSLYEQSAPENKTLGDILVPDIDRAKLEAAMLMTKRDIKSLDDYLEQKGGWQSTMNSLPELGTLGMLSVVEEFGLVMPTVMKKERIDAAIKQRLEPDEKLTANEELLLKSVANKQEYMQYNQDLSRPYSYGLMEGTMHSAVFMAQMAASGGVVGGAELAGMGLLRKGAQITGETLAKAALMPGTYKQWGENYTGMVQYDKETGNIHLRDDLYDRALQENSCHRTIAKARIDKLSSYAVPSEEHKAEINELRASLAKMDEVEDAMKPMGLLNAGRHALLASASEIVAEKFIGKGFDNAVGKLSPVRNAMNKFDRNILGGKYRQGFDAFKKYTGTTDLIQSIPGEMVEEYLVSPLHALNDWDTAPIDEWFTGIQPHLDVAAQTTVMGLGFRAFGLGISAKERWRNPGLYKDRKALRKQFEALTNAVEDTDVLETVDLANSQSSADVNMQRLKVDELRAKKDHKKADYLEQKIFSNMARKAFKTGTISEFENALESVGNNDNLSPETKANAQKAKLKIASLKDTYEAHKTLPNVGEIIDIEFDIQGAEETLTQLETHKSQLSDRVRSDIDSFAKNNGMEDIPYELDTLFDRQDESTEEGARYTDFVESLFDQGFSSIESLSVIDTAQRQNKDYLDGARTELGRQTSPEYQNTLKTKAAFTTEFSKQFVKNQDKKWQDLSQKEKDTYWWRANDISEKTRGRGFFNRGVDELGLMHNTVAKKLFEKDKKKNKITESTIDEVVENMHPDFKKGLSSYDIQSVVNRYKAIARGGMNQQKQESAQAAAAKHPKPPVTTATNVPEPPAPDTSQINAASANNHMAGILENQGSDAGIPAFQEQKGEPAFENKEVSGKKDAHVEPTVDLNSFDELPNSTEGFTDAQKQQAGEVVKNFTEQMTEVNGKEPTFHEMMEELVKHEGKEKMDSLYGAYQIGWEQNKYQPTDFNKVYKDIFDPLKEQATRGAATMEQLFDTAPTRENLDDNAEKVEKEVEKKSAPIVGFTVENVPIKATVTGNRIATPELKLGFSALNYTEVVENGKWRRQTVFDNQLRPDESGAVNYSPLLNPNQYNKGAKLGIEVAPESTWDKILINNGHQSDGKAIMISFADWLKNKEAENENFRDTQDFRNAVPMFATDGPKNYIAHIHSTSWYNAFNVSPPVTEDNPNGEVDLSKPIHPSHQERIDEGKKNVSELRNKILSGEVTQLTVENKAEGAFYRIPEDQPLITIAEANPQAVLAIQEDTTIVTGTGEHFENSNRKLLNKSDDFKEQYTDPTTGLLKYKTNGHTWDIRRIGVDPIDGKETWRAYPVHRKNENGFDGVTDASFNTLKWMWAAQAKLSSREDIKSMYAEKIPVGSPYDITEADARRIVDDIKRITGVNLLIPKDALDLMKTYGAFRTGTDLTQYGKKLFSSTPNGMAQNTDRQYLKNNNKVATIDPTGKVEDTGLTYQDWLKTQLSTNLKSFNVGTTQDPVYATSLQPIITYSSNSEVASAPKTMEEEVKESITEAVKQIDLAEDNGEDIMSSAQALLDSLGIQLEEDTESDELPNAVTKDEILRMISNVAPGLSIIQESQLTDFLFNHILTDIDFKHNGKVDREMIAESLTNAYNQVVTPSKNEVAGLLPKLETLYAANPQERLKNLINTYKKTMAKYESIEENWESIQQKAIDKATKYTEIREVIIEDEIDSEDEQTLNIKDHDKLGIEDSAKQKTSYKLRRFMAGVKQITADGKVKKGFLGVPTFMNFNDVYNSIAQFYGTGVDIPSDFDTMVAKLTEMEETHPWLKGDENTLGFIEKLLGADNQLKNEFVHNYTKHALSMKFAMYSTDKYGTVLKMYDTNAHEITRVIRDSWENSFKASKLIDKSKEIYSINKPYAAQLLAKYNMLGNEKHKIDDDKLRDFLSEFGLELPNEVWQEIKQGKVYYQGDYVSFEDMFYTKKGLFADLHKYLVHITSDKVTNTEFEETETNHPHKNLMGMLKEISKIQAKYTTQSMTLTFRDGGKQISGQVPPKYVTDRVSNLRRAVLSGDMTLINQLKNLSISSESTILELLANDPEFASKFDIHHHGITALKQIGKSPNNYSSVTDLNSQDHDITKLTGFQDTQQGNVSANIRNIHGFSMRMATMFLPTMSDKSQMMDLKTGVFNFMQEAPNAFVFNEATNEVTFTPQLRELLYKKMILPELRRIMKFHSGVKSTNIDGYDNAAQIFNFLPELNNVKDEDGIRLIEELAAPNATLESIEALHKEKMMNVAEQYFHEQAAKKKELYDKGIEKNSEGQVSKVKFFDKKYMVSGTGTLDQKYMAGIYDFVLNSNLTNMDVFTVIAGDPAIFAKDKAFGSDLPYQKDDAFYKNFAKTTGVNIGKRLALLIAPGNKLANSMGKKYRQIFLRDINGLSDNIEFLIDSFYEPVTDEIRTELAVLDSVMNSLDPHDQRTKKEIITKYSNKYPDIADYFDIESTDAQEYTTMNEHLNVLNGTGRITDAQMETIKEKLAAGQDLIKEELQLVFQPIKPVHTGQVIDEVQDVARTVYIKSSSFPLLPQMTRGNKLDNLRVAMEKLETETGEYARASYGSANKVGALKQSIDPFNDDDLENILDASLVLDRDNFRIQQDVPFKSDKTGDDTVAMGTQIFKLLFGDGMLSETNFNMPSISDKPISGQRLYDEFNKNFAKLIDIKKQELFDEIGLDKNGQAIDEKETAEKLQKLLKSEAIKRGYSIQNIKGLELDERVDVNGKPYYEFKVPLWLAADSNRYESLLNSIVSNRILKHKLPGNAYVVGSEAGFGFKDQNEDGSIPGIEGSRIAYLAGWNGKSLQAAYRKDGSVQKAQVLVPSKFKVNGKLVDLFQKKGGTYVYLKQDPTTKALMLNEDMVSPELLNLFTFRTPTSSHVSASTVEIVGILPPESGDLMIVPKNFTKQKGLDFDVDKETAYALHHVIDKNGKIVPLSETHKNERLKGIKKAIDAAEAEDKIINEIKELLPGLDEVFEDVSIPIIEKYNRVEREYNKKLLENEFIRTHNAVFSNPSNEVQKRINSVLSMDFAKSQAEMIDNLSQDTGDNAQFSILSDEYQKEKMGLGAAGKLAIGVYSNYVTFHSLAQQLPNKIQMVLPEGISSINIGGRKSDGIIGNRMTIDGERSTAKAFEERQNTATDNEKEQILGRVNVNSTTINVDSLLTLLGFDKDTNGNSIPYMFLSQPIIKEYVKRMNDARGITTDYIPDLENTIISELISEYSDGQLLYNAETKGLVNKTGVEVNIADTVLNADALLRGIENKDGSYDAKEVQLASLTQFLTLNAYAKNLGKLQGVVNTKNLGKSIIEANDKYNQLAVFHKNEMFENASQLIGEFADPGDVLEGEEGYIRVGDVMVKPTTPQGQIVVNGLALGNSMWTKYFPYTDESFAEVISEIQEISGMDAESKFKRIQSAEEVVQEIKKYIYSSKRNGIFNESAGAERARLFMDTDTNMSLANYMETVIKEKSSNSAAVNAGIRAVRDNRMANKFTYEVESNGTPSLIKFNNTSNDNFDDEYLYHALPELMNENRPLPPILRDGKMVPYSTNQLAQDLIVYAYVEGGVQQAIQFIKHIPVEYLTAVTVKVQNEAGVMEEMAVNEILQTYNIKRNPQIFKKLLGIKELNPNTTNDTHIFAKQYIQHHPDKARQFSEGERKKLFQEEVFDKGIRQSFMLASEGKPKFISVKNPTKSKKKQDKFTLYQHVGNGSYTRIAVLGTHGMNEYQLGADNATSLIENTPPPSLVKEQDVKTNVGTKSVVSAPFGLRTGATTKEVLEAMADTTFQNKTHLSVLAGYLIPFAKEDTTIEVTTDGESRGSYHYKLNNLKIDAKELANSEIAAQVFLHEFVHSVTSNELRQYYDVFGLELKENAPAHVVNLHMVFKEFRNQYTAEELAEFTVKQSTVGKEFSDYEVGELYPASSIFEFVARMLDSKELQEKMSKVKYKASNDSIWTKFKQAVLKTIKAIHPTSKGDSITDNAIAEILNFVEIEQTVVKQQKAVRNKTEADKNAEEWARGIEDNPPPDSNQWSDNPDTTGPSEVDLLPDTNESDIQLLPDCV